MSEYAADSPEFPIELLFADGKSFKIIVEGGESSDKDSTLLTEYYSRYVASDYGITADIASEVWDIDLKALRTALQEILDAFKPGSNREVLFTYGDFYTAIETTSTGYLDLLISLKPEPSTPTEFSFHLHLQQEEAKRLIQDIDKLL